MFLHRDNWDDLRYVLAVADSGSVSAAARLLGVNHATVLRRIAAFEERCGAELFERTASGYQISQDRQGVIDAAREVQSSIDAVARAFKGAEAQVSGVVRITSTDTLCTAILPSVVADLQEQMPDLRLELHSTNAHLDLSRLHADITVRPAARLPDELTGDRGGHLRMAVFAPAGNPNAPWLALRGALSRSLVAEWCDAQVEAGSLTHGSDSFVTLREMVASGAGRSVLPVCLTLGDARLEEQPIALPVPQVPLWVASHVDLGDSPRLRLLRRHLVEALRVHPKLM